MTTTQNNKKVAFVTGGATGIGKATIEKFLKESIYVGFLDNNKQCAKELQKQYASDKLLYIPGDVTKIKDVRQALQKTHDNFHRLDIVFSNAGVHQLNSIFDITEDQLDLIIRTNLNGTVFTIKEALPFLQKNGGGVIILMGSDQCFIGKKGQLAYGASKGAIGQITKSLALELAEENIRVNAICPGTIKTPLTKKLMVEIAKRDFDGDLEAAWSMKTKQSPIGRVGTPEEIAELVYFLSSDKCPFMTGSLLLADGGLVAG